MPAINYVYDPDMKVAANLITGETKNITMGTDISVFPQHGPFFESSLVLEGKNGAAAWAVLKPGIDYVYGPLYTGASAATGKEIFSYFLLIKTVTQVRYTYHVLGKYDDQKLMAEIAAAGSFNRASVYEWQRFRGDGLNWGNLTRDPKLASMSMLEVLVEQMKGIRDAIGNPYSANVNYGPVITELESRVSQILTMDDLKNFAGEPTSIVSVPQKAARELFLIKNPLHSVVACISFTNTAGNEHEMVYLMVSGMSTVPKIMQFGRVGTSSVPLISFSSQKVTGNVRVNGFAEVAGSFKCKIVAQF